MTTKPSIALIGCGKMGSALLRGWINADIARSIFVVEPGGLPAEFQNIPNLHTLAGIADLGDIDICVLAVKPQIMKDVCESLRSKIAPTTMILSIAAGQTIANFETYFGAAQPVIRSMPNTPAAIGAGMVVAIANQATSSDHQAIADKLLKTIGIVEWAKDESIMDAVTALSGSGPAYVFHLIEVMAEAGVQSGLSPDFAMVLARQTVIGSAALAAAEPDTSATQLRQNVTSPGGTTEAALNILMNEMQGIFNRALAAATARSKELSK